MTTLIIAFAYLAMCASAGVMAFRWLIVWATHRARNNPPR